MTLPSRAASKADPEFVTDPGDKKRDRVQFMVCINCGSMFPIYSWRARNFLRCAACATKVMRRKHPEMRVWRSE